MLYSLIFFLSFVFFLFSVLLFALPFPPWKQAQSTWNLTKCAEWSQFVVDHFFGNMAYFNGERVGSSDISGNGRHCTIAASRFLLWQRPIYSSVVESRWRHYVTADTVAAIERESPPFQRRQVLFIIETLRVASRSWHCRQSRCERLKAMCSVIFCR